MTTAPEVRAAARLYLPWMAAAPLVGIAAWMLDGIFIGATETRALRNAMLVSVAVYAAARGAAAAAFGNHGLWAALMILNATRGVTLGLRYPALEAADSVTPESIWESHAVSCPDRLGHAGEAVARQERVEARRGCAAPAPSPS